MRARRLARFGRVVAILCLLWVAGLGLAGLGILPTGDLPLGGALTGTGPAALRAAPTPVAPRLSDLVVATPAKAGAASATLGSAADVPPAGRRADSVALDGTSGGAGVDRGHRGSTATGGGGSSAPADAPAAVTGAPGKTSAASTTGAAGGTSGMAGAASGAFVGASSTAGGGGTHASGHGGVVAPSRTARETTPGHASTTARGNSAAAPGQVKQSASTTSVTTANATTPGRSGVSPGQSVTGGSGHVKGA